MEASILIVEISVCVVLGAFVREGVRRRSETFTAVSLWLLIPAGLWLFIDIVSDGRRRALERIETRTTWEERPIAIESVPHEWGDVAVDNPSIRTICIFWIETEAADATAPENCP